MEVKRNKVDCCKYNWSVCMAYSLQSLYKGCKTDFLCTLNILRIVCLNLPNLDFLLRGFCILRSFTRIMVKTYNCRHVSLVMQQCFHCAFLGFCLRIFGSNVQPGVGKFGCIWLEWFATGQGIWRQIFKMLNPHPMPCIPPLRWLYIDRW